MKKALYSAYKSRENLDSFSLICLNCQKYFKQYYVRERQNSKKKILKIGCSRIVHVLECAECDYFMLFCDLLKTTAYTAIVLVTVAVKVCLIELPKTD